MNKDIRAIAYVSHAAFDYRQQYQELAESIEQIRAEATQRNMSQGIGGVLYYYKGSFFQYLEGPRQNIDRLVNTIQVDPRHVGFKLMFDQPIEEQRAPDWGLKYVSLDSKIKQFLGVDPMHDDLYNLSESQAAELVQVFVESSAESIATNPQIQIVDPQDYPEQMASARMKLALLRPNLWVVLIMLALTAAILSLLVF
jgi:hypothetical protein